MIIVVFVFLIIIRWKCFCEKFRLCMFFCGFVCGSFEGKMIGCYMDLG